VFSCKVENPLSMEVFRGSDSPKGTSFPFMYETGSSPDEGANLTDAHMKG